VLARADLDDLAVRVARDEVEHEPPREPPEPEIDVALARDRDPDARLLRDLGGVVAERAALGVEVDQVLGRLRAGRGCGRAGGGGGSAGPRPGAASSRRLLGDADAPAASSRRLLCAAGPSRPAIAPSTRAAAAAYPAPASDSLNRSSPRRMRDAAVPFGQPR